MKSGKIPLRAVALPGCDARPHSPYQAAIRNRANRDVDSMLLSVCGAASPLTQAVVKVVEIISQIALGETSIIEVSAVAPLRESWSAIPAARRKAVLLYSACPQTDLVRLLIDSNAAVILCLDNFESIAAMEMPVHYSPVPGLRAAVLSVVSLQPFLDYSRTLSLTASALDAPIAEIIDQIAAFFGINIQSDSREKILAHLGAVTHGETLASFVAQALPQIAHAISGMADASASERAVVAEVAESYFPTGQLTAIRNARWPRMLFQDGDVPHRQLMGSIALTGPARYLFFGPYMNLSAGHWTIELQIELNNCRTDTIALADIYSGDVLNAVSMRFPRHGVYGFEIDFDVHDPLKSIEARLQLLKGAIEGELLFLGARLWQREVHHAAGEIEGSLAPPVTSD